MTHQHHRSSMQQEMPIPPMPAPPRHHQYHPYNKCNGCSKLSQMPPMQQMPQMPMPMHPVHPTVSLGVPCGWMPIFDADCHPYMYNNYPPQPEAMASPHLRPESPMHMSNMPMQLPVMPTPDNWDLVESPTLQFEESPLYPSSRVTGSTFEESPESVQV